MIPHLSAAQGHPVAENAECSLDPGGANIMLQRDTLLRPCRFDMAADRTPGAACLEFCLYEFPGCAGCPHAVPLAASTAEDPMKSAVLRGWIRGLGHPSG